MTTWSGFVNHLRIGYDIFTDSFNTFTPSINVFIQLSVQCDPSFNFNDSQTVNLSGSASASFTFQNTLGANGVVAVGTATIANQGQSFGGGPTYSFHAELDGVFLGAGPSINFTFTLPARPIRPTTPPGTPVASAITAQTASVAWSAPTDDGGSAPDLTWLEVATTSSFGALVYSNQGGGFSRAVTGLAPGTAYFTRAAVHNAAGWSGWSATGTLNTNAYQLGAPTVVIGPTSATVSWGNPPTADPPTGFQIQVATTSSFSTIVQTITSTTWVTTATVTGLTPGTTYFFRVRANTSTGFGAFSAGTSSKTLSGAKVRVAGAWKDGVALVRVGGAWKQAVVQKRVSGTWKL